MASKKDMAALFGNVGKQIEESRAAEPAKEEKKPEVKAKAPAEKKAEEKKPEVKQAPVKKEEPKEEKAAPVKEEPKETKPAAEAPAPEKPKRGRPKSSDTIVKRRMTLDLDEQAVDDVNKIIRILYDSKDKMSLTKVIEMSLRDFVAQHQKELDAYNNFRK